MLLQQHQELCEVQTLKTNLEGFGVARYLFSLSDRQEHIGLVCGWGQELGFYIFFRKCGKLLSHTNDCFVGTPDSVDDFTNTTTIV
ncbi:MAG: hypothetical protein LW864_07720, partial [Alphaproteobacteria bacterium]|nr:hypothetical protein [Alphaproteobacteria bacterium]